MEPSNSPIDPLEQLKAAFHADNASEVRRLLDAHPLFKTRINEPVGPFGTPAIVNAQSREMLDALLDAGANIDARSSWPAGSYGLLDSASPDLSEYAIARGATVTVHAAARLGKLDTLKALIAANSDLVNAPGPDGQTPLHLAATVEIAEFLLDHGADIDRLDVDHVSTPAQYMVDDRHEVLRFLISRGCKTDLLMAAAVGDVDLIRRILDADPDAIRTCVSDEYFPLMSEKNGGTIYQWKLEWYVMAHQVARRFGHAEALELLLARSSTPVTLLDACLAHDETAARLLSADGAGEFLTETDRRHVAHAARNDDTEAVRLMLESGFPVDATSQHGGTPLHWAAWHGNRQMTETILRFGPPLETRDADHNGTPLGWAIYGSEHGWNSSTGDYAGTVEALIEAGAELPKEAGGSAAVRVALSRFLSQ